MTLVRLSRGFHGGLSPAEDTWGNEVGLDYARNRLGFRRRSLERQRPGCPLVPGLMQRGQPQSTEEGGPGPPGAEDSGWETPLLLSLGPWLTAYRWVVQKVTDP